jgi:hypothetical protein
MSTNATSPIPRADGIALADPARVDVEVDERAGADSTSTSSTIVSDSLSTAPAATASPDGAPIFWRKRMVNAMRPAELGTVTLMNLTADASTTHGKSGSGVSTAPRSEIADGTKVS